jgi:hypothetical protein
LVAPDPDPVVPIWNLISKTIMSIDSSEELEASIKGYRYAFENKMYNLEFT